jgi:hypothetical protein
MTVCGTPFRRMVRAMTDGSPPRCCHQWRQCGDRKKICRRFERRQPDGLSAGGHIDDVLTETGEGGEAACIAFVIEEIGGREGIVVARAVGNARQADDGVRLGVRQGAKEDAVNDREDRRRSSYPERKRDECNEREARSPPQRPECVADVL